MRSAGILLVGLWALAADYSIRTVKVQPIENYPARAALAGITIAADPYATDEKTLTAFDIKDLNTRGYHAVHLIVQNSTKDSVTIRTRNITLATPDGQVLYATSAALVVQDVFKGGFADKSGSPFADFTKKELYNRQIDPGQTADGFLFFYLPKAKGIALAGATVVIPEVIDDATRKPIGSFAIPLDPALPAKK
jgi:hypothetical protein